MGKRIFWKKRSQDIIDNTQGDIRVRFNPFRLEPWELKQLITPERPNLDKQRVLFILESLELLDRGYFLWNVESKKIVWINNGYRPVIRSFDLEFAKLKEFNFVSSKVMMWVIYSQPLVDKKHNNQQLQKLINFWKNTADYQLSDLDLASQLAQVAHDSYEIELMNEKGETL